MMPKETQIEPWKRYRDAAIWHLLCLENSISANDILVYWEIIDNMIDLSLRSALVLLQNRYKYHINNMCIGTEKKEMATVSSISKYRLKPNKSSDERSVCAEFFLYTAIDFLQEEAERLVRL